VYYLPLDQRVPWQADAVAAAKQAIYDGFLQAMASGIPARVAGIIADESSGAAILRDAAAQGFATACTIGPVESPAATVDQALAVHASTCAAALWRVSIRYNPGGDRIQNATQATRGRALSRVVALGQRGLMCDLVVSPTAAQIARGIRAFDRDLRAELTARAMTELAEAGVEPAAWIFEGFEAPEEYARIVTASRRGGGHPACLVRANGYGDATTRRLMAVGLSVPGIAGVVLGPRAFWEPAAAWMRGRTTRAEAVATVASRFRSWIWCLESGEPERGCDPESVPPDPAHGGEWPQWS
jgi:myo-inositol catabolism protein IolC